MNWKEYPTTLGDVEPGRPFFMLNYPGLYMRVKTFSDMEVLHPGKYAPGPTSFNDDGFHVPIVNLSNGDLFYMAKLKPCRTT